MASPELAWALERVATDRARAGVVPDRYDVHAARAALPTTDLPLPEGTTIELVRAHGIDLYWVCPRECDPSRRVVFLHGGGYLAGHFGSHRSLVAWLAHFAKMPVLFPEYRLAPEHRFPAAVEDAHAALRWAAAHAPAGVTSPARAVFIAGDSAGGGLALAAMLTARDAGEPLPRAAALLCAMLDLDETTSAFLQATQRTRDMVRLYVSRLADLANPLASPIRADLRGLPPLLVQTGSADYVKDDSVRFVERARAAGLDATLEMWPDMIHVWQRFAPRLPEANEALQRIASFFRTRAD
jgi:epsilon-lactone hydrolase